MLCMAEHPEDPTPQVPVANNSNLSTKPEWAQPDWLLQSLVALVDSAPGSGFPVTLLVGGFLVSGLLTSASDYFDGLSGEAQADGASAVGASMSRYFQDLKTLVEEERAKHGHDVPVHERSFFYLKDARFFNTSGKPIPSNRGVWWRGRIGQVSGFNIGLLTAQ